VTTTTIYVCYLCHPERHTNACSSHAGIGRSRIEAEVRARYHHNQRPWCRTVPLSRAPRWAVEDARRAVCEWILDDTPSNHPAVVAEKRDAAQLALAADALTCDFGSIYRGQLEQVLAAAR
jgi:hypothetical protein